jgi:hypothetical protein
MLVARRGGAERKSGEGGSSGLFIAGMKSERAKGEWRDGHAEQ